MGKLLKLFSIVYIPMCLAFFVAESFDVPHVVVIIFWITMLGSGILYEKYPLLNNSKWSVCHFWSHSVGLPLVIASFMGYSLGNRGFIQVLMMIGSYPLSIFVLILLLRVVIHWKELKLSRKNSRSIESPGMGG